MNRLVSTLALLVAVLLVTGCRSGEPGVAYQNSTIDALLDGNYDGDVTFAELRKHGDFGIGTFDGLDGEMLAYRGRFWQVRSDGRVYGVWPSERTPFSVVTHFRPTRDRALRGPLSYAQLQAELDQLRGGADDGYAYAFAVSGRFTAVRTRSVPRQDKPYRPLAEVVKDQPTFALADVSGTLVGFWFPESMAHLNVPGYHFHFVTDDRTAGGHVLELTLTDGYAEAQPLSSIHVALPRRAPATRPTTDRAAELHAVEK